MTADASHATPETEPVSPAEPLEPPTGAAEPPSIVASHVAGSVEATSVQANLSAVGHVSANEFESVGSAVGFATAGRDAVITASMTPLVYAKGDVHIRQSYASAVLAGGTMDISQAGAPVIIGKTLSIEQGGGMVVLAGEASVSNGFVGVLLAPKATISEDTKVLLSTKAALIIAAALFGGFALVAVVMALGVRRVMSWRPQINVPTIPQMPDFGRMAQQFRHHNAA